MLWLKWLLLVCLWVCHIPFDTLAAQEVAFEKKAWKSLLAKARKENKLIFLDAYTTWCGPCRWMAKNTFKDPAFAAFYNQHFINVKMDMEQGEGLVLAKKYDIFAYPTLLFLDGHGQVVHRVVGALNAERGIQEGMIALDEEQNLAACEQKYANGLRDPAFLLTYLKRMSAAGLEGEQVANAYLATQQPTEYLSQQNWQILYKYIQSPSAPAFNYLLSHRKDFADLHTADSVEQKIYQVFYHSLVQSSQDQQQYEAMKAQINCAGWEGAEKLLLKVEVEVSKERGEWERYARAVVDYFAKYPSNDPNELNEHAWGFYEHVKNKAQLKLAEDWIVKALKLKETYSILDTYAALLYKLGRKEEAVLYVEKAIATAKASGEDYQSTEELQEKIMQMK